MAHGDAEPPAGTHRLDVRDAARGPSCSAASTRSATRRRWSAPASRVGDLPTYAGHNDLGTAALLAAMHERRVGRLVLASSMVVYGEGRYRAPSTATRAAAAGRRGARGR